MEYTWLRAVRKPGTKERIMKEEKNRESSRPDSAVEPSAANRLLLFWLKIERFAVDIFGICLLALAFMTLFHSCYRTTLQDCLRRGQTGCDLVRLGILWIILSLAQIGVWMLRRRIQRMSATRMAQAAGWRCRVWILGVDFSFGRSRSGAG
jgi:hypothetical protein